MRRIPNDVWSTIISVGYLGLMTNLMLLLACSPVVVLLMTTDPALSWPLIAAVAPVCAPALPGAFAAFRAYGRGDGGVVR
ncbi:MAG TPA: ferredoxin-NADPH reductase, partial [Rhodoglobus sp.]|nr:ferredoxin-NADPH reductase [Rhodoglobus sp.]